MSCQGCGENYTFPSCVAGLILFCPLVVFTCFCRCVNTHRTVSPLVRTTTEDFPETCVRLLGFYRALCFSLPLTVRSILHGCSRAAILAQLSAARFMDRMRASFLAFRLSGWASRRVCQSADEDFTAVLPSRLRGGHGQVRERSRRTPGEANYTLGPVWSSTRQSGSV